MSFSVSCHTMKKESMGSHMLETAAEHEPLLVHVSPSGLQSHSHKGLILKLSVCTIVILFLFLSSFLAFYGGSCFPNHHKSSLQNRAYFSNQHLNVGNWRLTGLRSLHPKITDLALICENLQHFANFLAELANFHSSMDGFVKQHQMMDDVVIAGKVETPGSDTRISTSSAAGFKKHISTSSSAVSNTFSRRARRRSTSSKAKVFSFLKIVQDLTHEGLLQRHHRVLCLDSSSGQKVLALKMKGFNYVEGIDISPSLSILNRVERRTLEETLADRSFDFVFTAGFDYTSEPALFVAEIERSLKVGGFAAMHVSLSVWRDKYITSKPGNGVKPVTLLFKTSEIVYVSTAYAPGLDTIIVFKKMSHVEKTSGAGQAEMDRKQLTFVPQPALHRSRSLRIYDCKKCIKEQQATHGDLRGEVENGLVESVEFLSGFIKRLEFLLSMAEEAIVFQLQDRQLNKEYSEVRDVEKTELLLSDKNDVLENHQGCWCLGE